MNPVFYLYKDKDSGNLLDALIREFKSRCWCFDELEQPYFHKYTWPDIVLSDRDAAFKNPLGGQNDFVIESLGCYDPEADQVILYMPKIRQTAEEYKSKNQDPTSLSKIVENLSTLILLHEFTHWIVAKGTFELETNPLWYSEPIYTFLYKEKEHVYFHEAVAQIFTNYFCKQDKELSKLFDWLEGNQPEQYQVYKTLLPLNSEEYSDSSLVTNKTCHLTVDKTFIDETIFALMILALRGEDLKRQNFTNLKVILGKIRGKVHKNHFLAINCFRGWDWEEDGYDPEKFDFGACKDRKRGTIVGKKFGL